MKRHVAPRRSPWHTHDFALLLLSGAVAQITFGAVAFAEPLIVLSLSGDVFQAGLVATVIAVVGTVSRALAATHADRHARRQTMIICSLLQLPVVGTLVALFAAQIINVPVFAVLSAASTALGSFTAAPELAAIAQLVPPDQLEAANGSYQARMYAALLIGPVLGGVLLAHSPILLYAAAFAASAVAVVLLVLISNRLHPSARSEHRFMGDFAVGWQFLFTNRTVRRMLLIQFWANVAASGAIFLLVVSLRQSGYSTAIIGFAQTAIGAGGLAGALITSVVTRHLRFSAIQITSMILLVTGLACATAVEGQLLMAVPIGAALILLPSAGASVFARMTKITPSGLRGRVLNFHSLTASIGGSFSGAAAGAIAGAVSMTAALIATTTAGGSGLLAAVTIAASDRAGGRR